MDQNQKIRPANVGTAVKLLYITLGIRVVWIIMAASRTAQMASPDYVMFIPRFFGLGIMWFFIYMIGKGRNWARITFLMLFIIGILFYILPLLQSLAVNPISGSLGIGQTVIQIIALVFLFQKPSSIWFKVMKAQKRPPQQGEESLQHKDTLKSNVSNKVFLPECFLCKKPMEDVEDWGLGLQGGDIICPHCKEKYHYSISRGEMTLNRAIVPVGFKGEIEKRYYHTENTSEKGNKMMNDHEMLSILKKLCNAYAQNEPTYKELEPIATKIGEQLNEHGGIKEMRRIFDKLGGIRGARTLEMHWDGIGDWRG